MNLIITSNPIQLKNNIYDYVDNFEIVCVRERSLSTMRTPTSVYQYDVWYHDGMDIEIETNDHEFQFHYYPTDVLTTALDEIAKLIIMIQEAILERDEDDVGNYPNVMDLYQYLRIGNKDDFANIMKNTLNTQFIYPEDPVAFGYAVYQTLKYYI